MALYQETQEILAQGNNLCDLCGDFIDFGGCKHDTPPIDIADADERDSYHPELYVSIGGDVIEDFGPSAF